jgi:hypothetical protein
LGQPALQLGGTRPPARMCHDDWFLAIGALTLVRRSVNLEPAVMIRQRLGHRTPKTMTMLNKRIIWAWWKSMYQLLMAPKVVEAVFRIDRTVCPEI